MDLAAWRCPAARATCSDRQVFLRFLGQGFWRQPGRRVALAALAVVAGLAAFPARQHLAAGRA
jgi:hypothetical protein